MRCSMPLPLLWLGAAALSAMTVKELATERQLQQAKRKNFRQAKKLTDLDRHEPLVAIYPTDLFATIQNVAPKFGAIVCCGIGGVLDHSGIWIGDDTILELDGRGLIKAVSTRRFTDNRTGDKIFVACDSQANCLTSEAAAQRAISQIFQYQQYHVINNNCHQFVWQCLKPGDEKLTTFKEFSERLARYFDRQVYWDLCEL